MAAYYNEIDHYAAEWLRNLIREGLIADGYVDERDVRDVRPDELHGFQQVHLFAGLGGWAYALRLAGVPDHYPIWTGSPPCQPFSQAGKRRGTDDPRHLWPTFFGLVRECRPPVIAGEQVSSAIRHGWYDALCDDLEGQGYACGAVIAPACGVGAPHIRERLFWLANPHRTGPFSSAQRGVYRREEGARTRDGEPQRPGAVSRPRSLDGFWRDADWLGCRDGKWRPVEPGACPLAHGVPARVGKLRAYGNAIVPQLAAAFLQSALIL